MMKSNFLGVQVDRRAFLWRPLSKRTKRVLMLPLSLLTIAMVALTAFAYLVVSDVSGSAATGVAVTNLGAWSCDVNPGPGSIVSIGTAADGRGALVVFTGVETNSRLRCFDDHTNSGPNTVCAELTSSTFNGNIGSLITTAGGQLLAGQTAVEGWALTFAGLTGSEIFAAETVSLNWVPEDAFADGIIGSGVCND